MVPGAFFVGCNLRRRKRQGPRTAGAAAAQESLREGEVHPFFCSRQSSGPCRTLSPCIHFRHHMTAAEQAAARTAPASARAAAAGGGTGRGQVGMHGAGMHCSMLDLGSLEKRSFGLQNHALDCTTPVSTRYGTSAASQGARPRQRACAMPKCGLQKACGGGASAARDVAPARHTTQLPGPRTLPANSAAIGQCPAPFAQNTARSR